MLLTLHSKTSLSSYLEPDDDEGDSIQAIKNSYKEKAKEKKTPKKVGYIHFQLGN